MLSQLIALISMMYSLLAFSQPKTDWSRYVFGVEKDTLMQPISIQQDIIIPVYKITFETEKVMKECSVVTCQETIENGSNLTWGGIFLSNNKLDTKLSNEVLAYRLSKSLSGLDPLLASKITSLNLLQKINLKHRPKTWDKFTKMIRHLDEKIKAAGINFDLYTEVTLVYGEKNARNLGYWKNNSCVKEEAYQCEADQLLIQKKLTQQTKKKLSITFQPADNHADVHLFEHEKDYFNIYIGENPNDVSLEAHTDYNRYENNVVVSSNGSLINVFIKAKNRKKAPLPDDFMGVFSATHLMGIFYEFRINDKYMNDVAISEMNNIYVSFELCENIVLNLGCNTIIKEDFSLSDEKINLTSAKSIFWQLSIKDYLLNDGKNYILRYKLQVRNSDKLTSPKNFSRRVKLTYNSY